MRPGPRHRPVRLAAADLGMLVARVARLLTVPVPTALLIGWCAGVLTYIGPTLWIMRRATPARLRHRAALLDKGEAMALAASLAAVASLFAAGGSSPREWAG